MKKPIIIAICTLLSLAALAQGAKHRMAIFTPLYLDSAMDQAGRARFDKTVPKYLIPGLEFYYGAQMAIDSLAKRGAPLEVFVYDTRGKGGLAAQLNKPELKNMELMIGQTNAAETRALADQALKRKLPFVSATFPNDAGVGNNPFFVVLNSTLQTHVESIYQYLQRNHARDRIVVFRKPGAQEDQVKNFFTTYAQSATGTRLQLKYVDLTTDMTPAAFVSHLDSSQRTVCIAGSLDEAFANKMMASLNTLAKHYPLRVIGMPTWDNLNFSKLSELEVVYTSAFYYNRTNALENRVANEFAAKYLYRPGDMFFRGYETTLRFGLLLLDSAPDLASNITRKGNQVLTRFEIEPEMKSRTDMTLDYFENKHLYFIRVFGGAKNLIGE